MARGQTGRVTALLIALAAISVSCSPTARPTVSGEPEPVATTIADSGATPTTMPAPTTTTLPTTTTTGVDPTTPETLVAGTEVLVPDGTGPFPAIVLVHGGGWIVGSPESMRDLAAYFTDLGFLTVNTAYHLSIRSPGFPLAVDDVACAVAFAASHPSSNGDVTLIGHSAGAHIAAVAAFDPGAHDDDCAVPDMGAADRLVGLAGPYDVDRLGGLMVPFFGVEQDADPELWESGNPLALIGLRPGVEVLLIHGTADQVVPADFSEGFALDLQAGGVEVTLEVLEGVDHAGARSPSIVGDLIAGWIGG